MWDRLRRKQPQHVVLPSLDRLSGLIERVVELVDAVSERTPEPEPAPEPSSQAPPSPPPPAPTAPAIEGWVAFVASPHGYRLLDGTGAPPARGTVVELEGMRYRAVGIGPSPLPGDDRRCAYVVEEEAPPPDRSSDA